MDAVNAFNQECKPEYKVPGLYVIDSIVRQSRHQFGTDKDVFGPRFSKNITATFQYLYLCPSEDKSKIVRVLNLWQKNGVFKIEIIQPLLDMAAGTSNAAPVTENVTNNEGSPPPPVKVSSEPPQATTNSVPTVPQLPSSDAFAAVAQLFQTTQGQQKLLDRFDYDDEPEAVEESKKEDAVAASATTTPAPAAVVPTTPAAAAAAATAPSVAAPTASPPQAPLSPKRRRSRSGSRSRRSRHRRSRSRSRDRRRHSPRSRSQERRDREKERERRQKGLPQIKAETASDWKGIPKKHENEVAQNGGAETSHTEPVSPIPKPLPVPVPPIPVPAPITVPPPQVRALGLSVELSNV
ncbi:hypothetical protein K5549_003406 [Capra hircus]|nr:hypothetical protein K5549_003406 [Capra hircus]